MEERRLSINAKGRKCRQFFEKVAEILTADGEFEVVKSPYSPDKYLIPKGTENQITFYGKPVGSLRLSDHWNWYAPISQCMEEWMVQCYNFEVPRPAKRAEYGESTKPKMAWQCAIYCSDGKYRAEFGDIFNRKTHEWRWLEADPEETAAIMRSIVKMERKLA